MAGADGEHDQTARGGLSINHAAVDLSQFRNEEVGKGYKAKHVVRQNDASLSAMCVVDMSGGKFSKGCNHVDARKGDKDGRRTEPVNFQPGTYLKSKGMRDFVREIEKILKPN